MRNCLDVKNVKHGFLNKRYLQNHVIRHGKNKSHKCSFCFKTFHTNDEKLAHEQTHNNFRKKLRCDFCDKVFKSAFGKWNHTNTVHKHVEKIDCVSCEKTCNKTTDMLNHFLTHCREKWHFCEICHKEFSSSAAKNIHMRCHTGNGHSNVKYAVVVSQ